MTVSVDKLKTPTNAPKSQETSACAADFEALFHEHWPRVYAIVYRVVGDRDEAEDIALEAFLKLHTRLAAPSRHTITSAGGWLYRVANNLGFNALRARKRRDRYERAAGMRILERTHDTSPDKAVEAAEERQRVRRVLARMKPRSAKILVLRYSGLSYAEVAAAVKVSPNSVGKLLSRAEAEFERRYRLEGENDETR